MVERDTVKGSRWSPAKKEHKENNNDNVEHWTWNMKKKKLNWGEMKVYKSLNKSILEGNGNVQESYHSVEMLSVLWGRGLCVCVFGVPMLLFVLGGGLKGVCAARGLGWCAWRSPREPESPPVLLHFPERIVFFLSKEERPAHRETGPKVEKLMTQKLKSATNTTPQLQKYMLVKNCAFMNKNKS